MVRDLSEDPAFADAVTRKIQERNVINHLMATRASLGFTQKDIAEKMGCSQSRVSKLESGKDDDLRIGDFHLYAEALGFQLVFFIGKKGKPPIAERIKYHTSALRKLTVELTELVGEDDAMRKGAWNFVLKLTHQLAVALAQLVRDVAVRLPRPHTDGPTPIRIEMQEDDPDDPADASGGTAPATATPG